MKPTFQAIVLSIACAVGGLGCLPVQACLNEYEPIPGVIVEDMVIGSLGETWINRDVLIDYILEAHVRCSASQDVKCNDLVVALIYIGAYERALQVSEGLIQQYPDEYNVLMANAVALELSGSTPWALALLKQAVALDPSSHRGSEWIHVNILEARVRNSTSQVTPAELIGIDLSADQIVAATPREKLDTLLNQLLYQLNDRYFFVQEAPDQIFGAMLYAYADLLFLTDRQTISARYYDMAEEYGFRPTGNTARRDKARQKHKLAEARREKAEEAEREQEIIDRYLAREEVRSKRNWTRVGWVLGALVVLGGGFLWWWRRR